MAKIPPKSYVLMKHKQFTLNFTWEENAITKDILKKANEEGLALWITKKCLIKEIGICIGRGK